MAARILPAAAQNTTATPPAANPPSVKKELPPGERKEVQQDRIANGVADGQLTAGEASRLEKKEGAIDQEQRDMRALDGGKLTAADKTALEKQQNQLSHQIYRQKHDAQTQNQNPKSEVGKREENQQDRIAQGIKSGQLTPGEASRLEKQEGRMNNEVKDMRQDNGGKLTQGEKAKVNKQENRESNRIYKDKHNNRR
jgi:hypothetical protein